MEIEKITFVVPVNDEDLFSHNFLDSPLFNKADKFRIIAQRGYNSASKAYNDALKDVASGIVVFVHQDVVLPKEWVMNLRKNIEYLDNTDPNWGVLGCYGIDSDGNGQGFCFCFANNKFLGQPFQLPKPVQSLDEIILIIRKSSMLHFDDKLPFFHLYGTDICLTAASKGMDCFAISNFCFHNSEKLIFLPNEFFECYKFLKSKWKVRPIHTTCITIKRYDYYLYFKMRYYRRLKYLLKRTFLTNAPTSRGRALNPVDLMVKLQKTFLKKKDII